LAFRGPGPPCHAILVGARDLYHSRWMGHSGGSEVGGLPGRRNRELLAPQGPKVAQLRAGRPGKPIDRALQEASGSRTSMDRDCRCQKLANGEGEQVCGCVLSEEIYCAGDQPSRRLIVVPTQFPWMPHLPPPNAPLTVPPPPPPPPPSHFTSSRAEKVHPVPGPVPTQTWPFPDRLGIGFRAELSFLAAVPGYRTRPSFHTAHRSRFFHGGLRVGGSYGGVGGGDREGAGRSLPNRAGKN